MKMYRISLTFSYTILCRLMRYFMKSPWMHHPLSIATPPPLLELRTTIRGKFLRPRCNLPTGLLPVRVTHLMELSEDPVPSGPCLPMKTANFVSPRLSRNASTSLSLPPRQRYLCHSSSTSSSAVNIRELYPSIATVRTFKFTDTNVI